MITNMYEEYTLQPCPKHYKEDQDKCILPEDTYNNAFAALKKSFPDLKFKLTELSCNEFYSVYDFDDGLLGSHGKGATKGQSMASAIMEYCERKSWYEYKMGNAKGFIKASYNQLKDKIDMSLYKNLFRIHFFEEKDKTEELLRDIPLYWVEAYNLTKKEPVLYPVNYIDILKSSNGLAAGNTKEEAITQGLCELIEREHIDNFLLDPYNAKVRIIDHSTIKNPYLLKLLEWAKLKKIQVYFFDISNTIPVTTILTHYIDNDPPIIYTKSGNGFGTHNDPEKAMIRAFTEFLQGRDGYLKDLPKDFNMTKGNWQTRLNLDFTTIINNATTISVKDCFNINTNDFKKDAEKIISLLKEKGHDVIALSLTHKDLKIPVYRFLIPKFKTGDEFSPFARNQHYTITFLMRNAKLDTKAWAYYLEHKEEIADTSEESNILIEQISKYIDSSVTVYNTKRQIMTGDIIYKLMMPRNHMNIYRFSSYLKRNLVAALEALGGIIINKEILEPKLPPEQDSGHVQKQKKFSLKDIKQKRFLDS